MRRARLVVVALVVSVYVSLVTASQCDSVVEALLLESTQHTTHWGEWSAQIPAVAHVQSGDVVRSYEFTSRAPPTGSTTPHPYPHQTLIKRLVIKGRRAASGAGATSRATYRLVSHR